jgi:hypothetical protein
MQLTHEQLFANPHAGNNRVLVKLPQEYSKYLHNFYEKQLGNTFIDIVTSGAPGEHAPRFGTLVKNPQKLIYDRDNYTQPTSMPHLTTIETQPGDIIFFDYQSAVLAMGKLLNNVTPNTREDWVACGEDLYIFLPYRSLLFAIRGESKWKDQKITNMDELKVICLNGMVIVENLFEEVKSTVIVPENFKQKKSVNRSKVLYCGSENIENGDGLIEADDIKPGDIIITRPIRVPVENGIANIIGNKNIAYVQRKLIFGVEVQE